MGFRQADAMRNMGINIETSFVKLEYYIVFQNVDICHMEELHCVTGL